MATQKVFGDVEAHYREMELASDISTRMPILQKPRMGGIVGHIKLESSTALEDSPYTTVRHKQQYDTEAKVLTGTKDAQGGSLNCENQRLGFPPVNCNINDPRLMESHTM